MLDKGRLKKTFKHLPKVVVPRPSSSISTSECTLACFNIIVVSANSTKNVDCFSKILSAAPENRINLEC